ncbi:MULTISPECIES: GntP family permease [Arthrobacter]|uniref:GntP family permease n=1 Tax=Arthrobacter caoxuetaonis TaxID=2886935 RepID=A0A9X1MGE6_9MICC|nr:MULTISPECIES: gluconate:H+ symporter [Arthrobacter]MCC3284024.1 GntP family permease [Arthrobacter caoxuetaonis]MCC3284032.1 GntP family permease [Arthrobacter caoxuetaonis]MCC3299643.1 GntP family permease [Arthrobacter caoxuetaonis]MCC9194485.1 GntP family permease [Arthrobacter sp. zg-Y916]USQ57884.1 GntP family permease [Arthrobacter caoxuetaonis]
MTDLELNWTLGTPGLLLIAVAAIALLLVMIMKFRIHAFLALIVVSLLTAVATGIPAGSIVPTLLSGFGTTLGSVALLVGLGAMLGRMLEVSGGAEVLTNALINKFGQKRASLALSVASLMFGFPIFFDAGLVVMLPIIFTVARRMGGSLLTYAFPAAAAFSVMHVFVPPHPGPVAATGLLGADIGLVLIFGLLIAIPTWYLTGYLFGHFLGRKFNIPVPAILDAPKGSAEEEFRSAPSLGAIVTLLLLPFFLIFLNTGLNMAATAELVSLEDTWVQILRTLGETPVALLITVFLAMWLLGRRQGKKATLIETVVDSALGPVCSIILITGAGGMFGGVLRASGIGDAIAGSLDAIGLPVIVAGFVIAAIIRLAQGSATVALTTAAALVQPVVLDNPEFNAVQTVAIVLSLAAGSVFAGHVNDSGFWLVSRFFQMDTKTTLKTWTVGQALIGVVGFILALAIYLIASGF